MSEVKLRRRKKIHDKVEIRKQRVADRAEHDRKVAERRKELWGSNATQGSRHAYTLVHCDGKGHHKIEKVHARSLHGAMEPFTGRRMTPDEVAAWKAVNQKYSGKMK